MSSDRISLKGMQFYGYHGVNPEEKENGQIYVVDLSVAVDLSAPGRTDRLSDTISYTDLYKATKVVIEGNSKDLLESLAQSIANSILEHSTISDVIVSVKKPHPPIKNSLIEHAEVTIHRYR
ncbi:MAG: dihydroneopterin aldolase [Dehalococcoidia bacterium]|nr:MAG: dihydroneopterin aldolase [Dehalococcoidia bacterium]